MYVNGGQKCFVLYNERYLMIRMLKFKLTLESKLGNDDIEIC